MQSLLDMMPGMSGVDASQMDLGALKRNEAIIQSMTPEERSNPKLINVSRKQRIAKGCGMDISEINRFMKQFEQSQKMMKQFSNAMGGKGSKKRRRGRFSMPFGL